MHACMHAYNMHSREGSAILLAAHIPLTAHTHTHSAPTLTYTARGCGFLQNPTPDVLDGKLRLLRLHKESTFTWGELAHVWCAAAEAEAAR
jgi:hypothetical protein